MKSAVLQAPRQFAVVERDIPEPQSNEVVVRTAATAVCHTDLDMFLGHHPGVRYPIVLGHEATGTVVAAGATTKPMPLGQHVIINPVISCGRCDCCLRGDENLCRNAGVIGREFEGSFSQYIRVPERNVHALPAHLPLDQATLIETLATVRHAQLRANISSDDVVVVFGQGTTGLLHTRLAALSGAKQVIGVSRTPWKLELATRMGARDVIRASIPEAVDRVRRLTGGKGADVVLDTAGGTNTLRAGIELLRPGGRYLSFSLNHEDFDGLNAFQLYYKEVSIIGARALKATDMGPAIDLVSSGKVDGSVFITARFPLDDVMNAFDSYEKHPNNVLRIVIDP